MTSTRTGPRRNRARAAAIAAVVPLALFGLGACGGGDGSGGAGRAAPSAGVTSAAAARPLVAKNYVVTEGADTAGLVRDTSSDDDSSDQDFSEAAVAKCLGVPVADVKDDSLSSADGVNLQSSDEDTELGSSADIEPAGSVPRDTKILERAQTPACLGQLFEGALSAGLKSEGGTATLTSATRLTPPPTGATYAARLVCAVNAGGNRFDISSDVIFILSGRVESTIILSQLNGLPDPTLEQKVTTQVANKITHQ